MNSGYLVSRSVHEFFVPPIVQTVALDGFAQNAHASLLRRDAPDSRGVTGMIEQQMSSGGWASGDTFTMADCAAAPALFYGSMVVPFGAEHGNLAAYFGRLKARPSFARVMEEAKPYFNMVPKES
jgi:glutathione S-transferase